VIDNSVRKMPSEVYQISGKEISDKLKSRRGDLEKIADSYYSSLAKEVNIVGTDKKEFFKVNRINGQTAVTVYKIDKNDKLDTIIYNRTFYTNETQALNLYALAGKDSVVIEGNDANPIKIRIVGGAGDDYIANNSTSAKLVVYDTKSDNTIQINHGRSKLSDKAWVNKYDPSSFQYDEKQPVIAFDFNPDDGLFLGGGIKRNKYGFRSEPYSSSQSLRANYAPNSTAYTIKYAGTFFSLFGRNNDLVLNGSYNSPKYTIGYYGEGNSTLNPGDPNLYNRLRSTNLSVAAFRNWSRIRVLQGRSYSSAFCD
jgi:hypothetical protein